MTLDAPDVVVVGAGPVGLWAAAELRLNELDVVVLEATAERDTRSRAVGMSAGSIETFATRGIAHRFIDAGVPIHTSHFGASSTRLDLLVLGVEYPFSLCIPQTRTEALLEDYTSGLGVRILRGMTVVDLAETPEHVTVTATGAGGDRQFFSAAWVVGCDGTRSVVRSGAGIDFPGTPGTHTGWLADVRLTREPDGPIGAVSDDGAFLLQAIGDGLYRAAGVDIATMYSPPEEPPDLNAVRRWARQAVGDDFGMHSPAWISRYGNARRLAATYVKGRVAIAGDAAHQFFPAGGQGINTGLQDASNLAWKLAAVIHGRADNSLLQTYTAERRPAAEAVMHNTDAQLALFAARSPGERALRDVVSEALLRPGMNAMWARRVTGFADPVPRVSTGADSLVGRRLSHLRLDGSYSRLHELMAADRFLVLDLDEALSDIIATEHATRAPLLDHVCGLWDRGSTDWDGVHAVLVRPDARIAWVARHGCSGADHRDSLRRALNASGVMPRQPLSGWPETHPDNRLATS